MLKKILDEFLNWYKTSLSKYGQGAIEYILTVAMVIIAVILAFSKDGAVVQTISDSLKLSMGTVKTGSQECWSGPVDGGWTAWSTGCIDPCSRPCHIASGVIESTDPNNYYLVRYGIGTGVCHQFRECANPVPACGGTECSGINRIEIVCPNTEQCPFCGDGICNPTAVHAEDSTTCPSDC